jgi:hypothetical protein
VAGYEVLEEMGRGPTGVAAYRARQTVVSRTVLLKVVQARQDPGQLAWGSLRGEAAALGKLQHPNIVQIHEAGERERQLFYNAVELVDGPTLAQVTRGKPLAPRQAVLLVETLARAVHHAHEKGVVHRSLKPASVVLQPLPRTDAKRDPGAPAAPPCCEVHGGLFLPRITDWGQARRPVEGDVNDAELQGEQPYYLSPEQAWGRSKEIGPASDVYALGAILYELLTGRPPHKESSAAQMLDSIQGREPPPPSRYRPGLAADLDAVCRRCLANQARRRYVSALDLAADLRRWLSGLPVKARPISHAARAGRWLVRHPQGVAVAVLAAVACGCLLALSRSAARPQPFQPAYAPTAPVWPQPFRPAPLQAQQEATQLRAQLQQEQRRAAQALYFQRISLADRALQARDSSLARENLDACSPLWRSWEWYYLDGKQRGRKPAVLALSDQRRIIRQLAFSPDNRSLAACALGGEDQPGALGGEAAAWGLERGAPGLAPLQERTIKGVAYSPDGFRLSLLVDDGNRTVMRSFHAAGNGEELGSWVVPGTDVTAFAYSGDGARLLLLDRFGHLRLLLASTGSLTRRSTLAHGSGAYGKVVALNADGSRFAAVTPDGTQVLVQSGWQAASPTVLPGTQDLVLALAANVNTGRVAAGSRDHSARLWNSAGGQATLLRGHRGPVTGVAFTEDGGRLASCSDDGTVKVWDPATGLELLTVKDFEGTPTAVAFSPHGKLLAVARGGALTVWGLPEGIVPFSP